MDHYVITVDTAELSMVEKTLTQIGTQFSEEGGKLANLPGQATDWTGQTADTLKSVMGSIAADMIQSQPYFATATTAVATFRAAAEQAQTQLATLNSKWHTAQDDYATTTKTADAAYNQQQTYGDAESRQKAGTSRDGAKKKAADDRKAALAPLDTSFAAIRADLEAKANACGEAFATAVRGAIDPAAVRAYQNGVPISLPYSAAQYFDGTGSPFPSPVDPVVQSLVDQGLLPPGAADWTPLQLTQYLIANPSVAVALVNNAPTVGDPTSAASQLAQVLVGWNPDATGEQAEQQRIRARALFNSLSKEDQERLAILFPAQVGNLGGAPFDARAWANRVNVVAAKVDIDQQITTVTQQIAQLPNQGTTPDGAPTDDLYELQQKLSYLTKQRDLYDGVINDGVTVEGQDKPPRYVVLFDAASGQYAEASGPIDETTTNVAVLVPGTGTNLSNVQGTVNRASTFSGSDPSLVTIAWMGGNLPQGADAAWPGYAQDLGPRLAEFSKELRQETSEGPAADNDVKITLAGHSYGGEVVAQSQVSNADADRVLYIESAGMGVGITPDQQNPANSDQQVYSMTAPGDFIEYFQGSSETDVSFPWLWDPAASGLVSSSPTVVGTGDDPDTWTGTTRLYTGYDDQGNPIKGWKAHSNVFDYGSDSWDNMFNVFTGGQVVTYAEPDQTYSPQGAGTGTYQDNDPKPGPTVDIP